ncbi:EAL domain-containing protein [Tissierellaceae bacterium HCP3S3_D8]
MSGLFKDMLKVVDKDSTDSNLNMNLKSKREDIYRRFEGLIHRSDIVFEIVNIDGITQYISPAVEEILGYSPKEIIGKQCFEIYQDDERTKFIKMLESTLYNPDKRIYGNFVVNTKSGKEKYIYVSMSNRLSEPDIQGILLNWIDNTRQMQKQMSIEYIATHDELTKLPNRILLKSKIEDLCQIARQTQEIFGVIMLDIDNFKYINDSLGYRFGDKIILEIVQRLKRFLGDEAFICRYSEDHFVIIAQGLEDIEDYESYSQNIINIFLDSIKIDRYELDMIANIGGSIYSSDAKSAESLIKYANIALLRGKREGGNKVKFYSSNIGIQNYKQLILRNNLRKSIEKGQLRVYYQPQINLQTNYIMGAEALIRWEHPDWGILFPDEFISFAEETGFIINLGNWMLKEICRNYKKWMNMNISPINISINYSSVQFLEKDLVKNIGNIISEFGLDPKFLTMEITESVLVTNIEKAISVIKGVRDLGIQVALDDFGTGFSSLSYLNTFNIDILKIDRSFIKEIPDDKTSTIITSCIIDMARELGIKSVIEGIETQEQLEYLKKLDCHCGQGYIYSKPMPLDEFEELLSNRICEPKIANKSIVRPEKERRRFFRIQFFHNLEAVMTIMQINGRKVKVSNTRTLIKNMGPGGLCFISNIRFPIKEDVILQFTTELLEQKIKVYGNPVWTREIHDGIYEYGIKFTFGENERVDLIRVLNQVQIKMRNNMAFAKGRFISDPPILYFKEDNSGNQKGDKNKVY